LSAFYVIFFFLGLFIRNDLTLSADNPAIKTISLFQYEITYYEATPGIIFFIGMMAQFFNFIYVLHILIKNYRLTRSKYIRPIIAALLIFFLATINDYMVANRVYIFIYTVEYSYLILVLSMTYLLVNRFIDMKDSVVEQLYVDTLTSLPNRTKLLLDIDKMKKPFIILINIDSFKEINDFYGNETGDFVLLEMVNRLKKLTLGYDYHLYKMHGDEYAILINSENKPAGAKLNTAHDIARYLFEEINDNVFRYNNHEINVRVTIGIADYSSIGNPAAKGILMNKVLNNADMVLKEAKKNKKSFLVYDDSMEINKEYENNIFWANKLKKAIRDDRILPYYQPIINNRNGKIEKYECLARMIDTDGKVISPIHFLDVSQKVRLYNRITGMILRKSFKTFSDTHYEFGINLSVKDILNQETNQLIQSMLKDNLAMAPRVVFEILESEGIGNFDVMTDFIRQIKTMGCKIAIDDFGSGYSNFNYLIKLKVDYIKIDASIIKNLDQDHISYSVAKMIVNAAKELNLLTIAEFVHSKAVYEKCMELGIDYSQGYYFSEPKQSIQ
jgi:diguanylate cyclase (GGDEF)-like protein